MCSENEQDMLAAVQSVIPKLVHSMHKGQAGRIGVIGGCEEYTGAPYFAAISAMKVGADLSHVFCAEAAGPIIKSYSPELIVHPFLDKDVSKMSSWLPRLHTLVIGPGLGNDIELHAKTRVIIDMAKDLKIPLVLDAEGIKLRTRSYTLLQYSGPVILTPNLVEFNALYKEIMLDESPIDGFSEHDVSDLAAKMDNVTIVKKGHVDIISNGRENVTCGGLGGPRRCGGQGDLLAGSLAVFLHWARVSCQNNNQNVLVQKYGPEIIAAYGACCLSKTCNEIAYKKHGRSMLTTDMISCIHEAFDKLFPENTAS